jgi:hypothetical protein
MKVKATKTIFYKGARKRPGAVFVLTDQKHFSRSSMERMDVPKPKDVPKPDGGSK